MKPQKQPVRPDKTAEVVAHLLDGDKVALICSLHNYTPGGEPRRHTGCVQCIMCDFVYMFANTPVEKQKEDLDRFEALIHALCELEDEGKLDVNIQRHPTLTIEKDALPDA